jgi:hypothetical protein
MARGHLPVWSEAGFRKRENNAADRFDFELGVIRRSGEESELSSAKSLRRQLAWMSSL